MQKQASIDKPALFTVQILSSPIVAISDAKQHGFKTIGVFDITLDLEDPQTLLLVEGSGYDLARWHDEPKPSLVWSIKGDYLNDAEVGNV